MASAVEGFSSGWVDPADVMTATAQSSGQVLGGQGDASVQGSLSAAAAAAFQRNPQPMHRAARRAEERTTSVSGIEGLGHRDRGTEQLERAMRRLGSVDADLPVPDAGPADAMPTARDSKHAAKTESPEEDAQREEEQPTEVEPIEQTSLAAEASGHVQQASSPQTLSDAQDSGFSTTGDRAADAAGSMVAAEGVTEAKTSPSGRGDATTTEGRFREAERAARELKAAAASEEEASTALQTLSMILRNALNAPQDDRYRRLRPRNPAFSRRLGRFPQALEVLHVAGFQQAAQQNGDDPVLALDRTDPGLLWLALEAVQTAMASG